MAALPAPIQSRIDALAAAYFEAPGMARVDFSAPAGAAALCAPASVTWQVMKNPVALVVGGIAAVILELAEPRVRTGVWEHTSFRRDPVMRMKRTGFAAMVTVYGPAEAARAMIKGVVEGHARVAGQTPSGQRYCANDPDLLDWVQATASFGFLQAYRRFVRPLEPAACDQFLAESAPASALYGATGAPRTMAEMEAALTAMAGALEPSPIVFEFLDLVRAAPILPSRTLVRQMVRAAVEITPAWVREILGLAPALGLRPERGHVLALLGAAADRIPILSAPPAQASARLGLARDYLYR